MSLQYIGLSVIVWLTQLGPGIEGALQGILFLFASPLLEIAIFFPFYIGATRRQPSWVARLATVAVFANLALQPLALLVAWLAGYQLWYPQFAIYSEVLWLLVRVITRQPFSYLFGLSSPPREMLGGSAAMASIALLVDGVANASFAYSVARGIATVSIRKSCGYRWVGSRLPAQTRTRSQDFRNTRNQHIDISRTDGCIGMCHKPNGLRVAESSPACCPRESQKSASGTNTGEP